MSSRAVVFWLLTRPRLALFAVALAASPALVPVRTAADCTIFCNNPSTLQGFEQGNVPNDNPSLCFAPGFPGRYCAQPMLLGSATY